MFNRSRGVSVALDNLKSSSKLMPSKEEVDLLDRSKRKIRSDHEDFNDAQSRMNYDDLILRNDQEVHHEPNKKCNTSKLWLILILMI